MVEMSATVLGVVVEETRNSATNARARRSARASGTARRRGRGLVGAAMVDWSWNRVRL